MFGSMAKTTGGRKGYIYLVLGASWAIISVLPRKRGTMNHDVKDDEVFICYRLATGNEPFLSPG